jgi:hypothetical protein
MVPVVPRSRTPHVSPPYDDGRASMKPCQSRTGSNGLSASAPPGAPAALGTTDPEPKKSPPSSPAGIGAPDGKIGAPSMVAVVVLESCAPMRSAPFDPMPRSGIAYGLPRSEPLISAAGSAEVAVPRAGVFARAATLPMRRSFVRFPSKANCPPPWPIVTRRASPKK